MNLSPADQAIQYISWFLALTEFIVALYVLVLNARHIANRRVHVFLMISAVTVFALGYMESVEDVAQAVWPTVLMAATAPAAGPWSFLLTLTLLKPACLRDRCRWIPWLIYGMCILPVLFVVSDVWLGTRLWYTGLDAATYVGGFVSLNEFANGSFSLPIQVLSIRVMPLVAIPPMLYVALRDRQAQPLSRWLAWLLLVAHVAAITIQMGLRGLLSGGWPTLITGTLFVLAYGYAAFQQMISERRLQRGRLQTRLTLLILVVTIPVLVVVVAFVSDRAGDLVRQAAVQPEEELLHALWYFQRVSWAALAIAVMTLWTLAWLVIRQALRPISTLTSTVAAIAAGDLARAAPVESEDEIGVLARAFNDMTEQLRGLIDRLEQRVADRTAELTAANERLQQEIAERQRVEEQLRESLGQKEVLLHEIHHRVKNNLQVISSLLSLEAGSIDDLQTIEILQDSQDRVRSMALIHEKLYQSRDLARVDFGEYIRSLAGYLFRTYSATPGRITLNVDVRQVLLPIHTAIPCGLIVNELLSNALKHAFPDGRAGEIRVAFHSDGDGRSVLAVRDDGVGLPRDLDFLNTGTLGLQLVHTLVGQLEGDVDFDSDGGTGTAVWIAFSESA